jgi:3-deoxy-D-manno-octulosonic-acid transferase
MKRSGIWLRSLYAVALGALLPLYFARLWWRGRKEAGYRRHWRERLGIYGDPAPEPGVWWLHAVSLGETRAAASLIDQLRQCVPGMRLLLTHGTASGRDAGRQLMRAGDMQAWLPVDTPGSVRRFMRHFRPAVGVLMETEAWPSLLMAAQAEGVPMALANGRLSERSLAKGLSWHRLLAPPVQTLRLVMAQTEADAERLRAFGVRDVRVCGNVKFDVRPDAELLARGHHWRSGIDRPVVMMASSREGEERPLLEAWLGVPAPRPLLLIVPRHPQRFDTVAALVQAAGLKLRRRSQWGEAPPPKAIDADVWLGDSLGEMPLYAACSHVALLGGSFEPLGGQNLIELAASGCPVVMGPHTFNFAIAAEQALQAGAAERATDIVDAVHRACSLAQSARLAAAVDACACFCALHQGASHRKARLLADLVNAAPVRAVAR